MRIDEYCEQRYLLEKSVGSAYGRNLLRWCGQFHEFARVTLKRLRVEQYNKWVVHLEQIGTYAPITIRKMSGGVLSVWNHAAKHGCAKWPETGRIRRVQVVRRSPCAWTDGELRDLLDVVRSVKGDFTFGVSKSLYYDAALRVAYDTGLRRGDLFGLDVADVARNGVISTVQGKTLEGHVCRVRPATHKSFVALANHIASVGLEHWQTPLKWPKSSMEQLYTGWRCIRWLAGVEKDGAFQMLRRTGATQVEIAQPGAATQFLGHLTPVLAQQSYVDRSQLPAILPPDVEEAG